MYKSNINLNKLYIHYAEMTELHAIKSASFLKHKDQCTDKKTTIIGQRMQATGHNTSDPGINDRHISSWPSPS